jgi:2-aminomuconate deaminase
VHELDDGSFRLDIAEQTEAVIENMRAILNAAGLDLDALVDLTTFLVDMKDYPGYNAVYDRYFDAQTGPSRTTVAVHQLPHPNLLIEIKGIAFIDDIGK